MKFVCSKQELSKSLNIVSKAVSVRTTIPSLKGILLKVENDELILTASDMDITIEDRIKIINGEEGSIIAPSKLFGDMIRKLPGDDVTVWNEEEKIYINSVKSDSLKFDSYVTGMAAEDFVNIKNIGENATELLFDKDIFTKMIKKTAFAASIDQTKGVITGVLIELKKDSINMVAIDGYRMAICKENTINAKEKNIIISAKIMNELVKIISDSESRTEATDVKLIVEDKSAILHIASTKVIMRLVAGDFIKYRDVLPKENSIKVKVNRRDLAESVERASLLSKEGKNNLIKLAIKDDYLTITSRSEEGNIKEDVLISKEGEDLKIGFNAKYITDMLRAIDDEEIIMEFNNGRTPLMVRPVEGDEYNYIVLPVRINNL